MSSVLLGPLVLIAMSGLIATLESRAEQREVYVVGSEHAPTLVNFLERQTYIVKSAPADYEAAASQGRARAIRWWWCRRTSRPPCMRGDVAGAGDGQRQRQQAQAEAGTGAPAATAGRLQPRARPAGLALRGVSARTARADARCESATWPARRPARPQLTGMLPFFVLMAVLYGALNAALDTTAGERERGSLEPLLMNPADRCALVLGKWGAVATRGDADRGAELLQLHPGAVAACAATRWQALFQFGLREALLFLAGAAALRGGAVGAADGGGDPLQDLQGGAGQHQRGGAGGVAAAAGERVQPGRRGGLAPVGCRRSRRTR